MKNRVAINVYEYMSKNKKKQNFNDKVVIIFVNVSGLILNGLCI